MKLKNKLEVEETLEVGVLPNAPTNNFSVVFETLGMFQRRQVGNIINKNDTDFLPSVSNSFPTSVFAFNVSTTNANPNLTVSFVNQVAGTVFAAPQSLNGTPAFRMLQDSDLSQTSLGSKANANGDNLTNIQDWQDNLNVVTTNTTQTGLSGDKTSSGIWTLGQIRKAGQSDTQILLAGGGHRPVSDFALAGSLDNYVFNVTQNSNRGRLYHKSSGTIQFPSIPVIDIRSTVSGLGTPDGTSSYLPLSNDVSLNNTMTPIFHYRKNTTFWVSSIMMKGWTGGYGAWMISGNANNTTANVDKWFLSSTTPSTGEWDNQFEILHSGNYSTFVGTLLGNYLPLAGGTMTGDINWTAVNTGLSFNNTNRLRFSNTVTVLSSVGSGGDSIFLRPQGDSTSAGQVTIQTDGQINTANHGDSSQWKQAYDWGDYALNTIVFNDTTNNPTNSYNSLDADLTVNSSRLFFTSGINTPISTGFIDTTVYSNGAFQMVQGDHDNFYYRRRFGGTWRTWNQVASREWADNKFALASSIVTPNNGLLTISTSSDLTGGGTFSADQATASNVNIGLSSGTLASLALANTAVQPSALNNYYQSGDVNIPALGGNYRVFPNNTASSNFDLNDIETPGFYYRMTSSSNPNNPKSGGYFYIETHRYASSANNITQYAHPYRVSDGKWMRNRFQGNWSDWVEFIHSGNLASYANTLLTDFVPTSRTITINGTTFDLSQDRTWTIPDNDTITRLRGTTSGTYTSGDLTLLAGANTTITQSGATITIASTNTNTTYSGSTSIILSGTSFQRAALTGDVTASQNSNATTIANGVVTNAKLANMGIGIKGRNTGTGAPLDLTVAQVQAMLGVTTVNNGSFTVQGTGSLTGTGSTSANASANTVASLDLTTAEKNRIQQGVDAYGAIPSLIDGVDYHHLNTGGHVPIERKKTIVNIPAGSIGYTINVDDAPYEGYELAINGCGEWSVIVNGSIMNKCGNTDSITLGGNQGALFWWSVDLGMWIQAI